MSGRQNRWTTFRLFHETSIQDKHGVPDGIKSDRELHMDFLTPSRGILPLPPCFTTTTVNCLWEKKKKKKERNECTFLSNIQYFVCRMKLVNILQLLNWEILVEHMIYAVMPEILHLWCFLHVNSTDHPISNADTLILWHHNLSSRPSKGKENQ